MKKKLTHAMIAALALFPLSSGAAFPVGWNASTSAESQIQPNALNGTNVGISVLGTSTLSGYTRIGPVANPLAVISNYVLDVIKTIDGYAGTSFINPSTGTSASVDVILNNNRTTETSFYTDFGMNGGNYNGAAYPTLTGINRPSQTYLYNTDDAISIGTATSSTSGFISFLTGGLLAANERARVTSDGSVGIGTTSPIGRLSITGAGLTTGTALHVANSANAPKFTVLDSGDTTVTSASAGSPTFTVQNTNSDSGASALTLFKDSTSPAVNDSLGTIRFQGKNASGSGRVFSSISSKPNNVTGGAEEGILTFSNFVNGVSTDVMIINEGSVSIGTTTPTARLTISDYSSAIAVGLSVANADGMGGSVYADNSSLYFAGPTGGVPFIINDSKIRMQTGKNIELSTGSISKNGNSGGLSFNSTTDVDGIFSQDLLVTRNATTTGIAVFGSVARLKGYTVATLPAGVQGDTAFVTDALAPTYLTAVTGGGAVVAPVFHNGTAWVTQ